LRLGRFQRRLLHEAPDLEERVSAGLRLDIAVTGMRAVGLDAERDERARVGCRKPGLDRIQKGASVADHVVGRGEQEQGLFVLARGDQRGDAGRRPGIAAHRLEHDVFRRLADLLELLGDQETMAMIGEHPKGAEPRSG